MHQKSIPRNITCTYCYTVDGRHILHLGCMKCCKFTVYSPYQLVSRIFFHRTLQFELDAMAQMTAPQNPLGKSID